MWLDFISIALQNSINVIKTALVGDLSYHDVQGLMQRRVPQRLLDLSDYANFGTSFSSVDHEEFQTQRIIVRQYGLLGWLFNLNMAVIKATDTDDSKQLLHTLDNKPDARRPFGLLEMTPGVTTLPSLFGERGLELHKDFVRIMPSATFMIETSALLTKETIKNWTTDLSYTLILCGEDCDHHQTPIDEIHISSMGVCLICDENKQWQEIGTLEQALDPAWLDDPAFKAMLLDRARQQSIIPKLANSVEDQERLFYKLPYRALQRLAQTIVISLLIDDRMVDETLQLIQLMKDSSRGFEQKQAYNVLLKKIIQGVLADNKHQMPKTALHKAIDKANTTDPNELAQNALICSVFSSLAALENVEHLLSSAVSMYSNYPNLRTILSDQIQSNELSFQLDEMDGGALLKKIQSAKWLDHFFKDALKASTFQPRSLPRYLSQPFICDGVHIPAGTNVFVLHRSNEKHRDDSHRYKPLFTETQSAPALRTTEAAAFSYGNRSCPGNKLTEYVVKSIIAVFVDFMAQASNKPCERIGNQNAGLSCS